jgi:hypothetical protein
MSVELDSLARVCSAARNRDVWAPKAFKMLGQYLDILPCTSHAPKLQLETPTGKALGSVAFTHDFGTLYDAICSELDHEHGVRMFLGETEVLQQAQLDQVEVLQQAQLDQVEDNQGSATLVIVKRPHKPTYCDVAGEGNVALLHHLHKSYVHKNGKMATWDGEECVHAAGGGHLECMVFLFEHGFEMTEEVCDASVLSRSANATCLRFAVEHGGTVGQLTAMNATEEGNLPCLQYLDEIHYRWTHDIFTHAVCHGRRECIEFLFEIKCPFTKWVGSVAVRCGSLECLKFLHEKKIIVDEVLELMCIDAYTDGHFECIQFLHTHGYRLPKNTHMWATCNNHLTCANYIKDACAEYVMYD